MKPCTAAGQHQQPQQVSVSQTYGHICVALGSQRLVELTGALHHNCIADENALFAIRLRHVQHKSIISKQACFGHHEHGAST